MLTKLSVIVFFSPIFLFPGIGVAILGITVGNLYLKAQLSVKREMRYTELLTLYPCFHFFYFRSNARSPLLAHFNAAIHGLGKISNGIIHIGMLNMDKSFYPSV